MTKRMEFYFNEFKTNFFWKNVSNFWQHTILSFQEKSKFLLKMFILMQKSFDFYFDLKKYSIIPNKSVVQINVLVGNFQKI